MASVHRIRTSTTGRVARLLAQGVVLTAVVGGTVAYADSGMTLSLSVDGRTREIQAGAATVGQLLDSEAIELSAFDLVAPEPETELVEGQDVIVQYARPLTVTVDGEETTYTTTELTLEAALTSLGIPAVGARLSAPLSLALPRTGTSVTVTTPKTVALTVGGTRRSVTSAASTVGELLREQSIRLGDADRLSVDTADPVAQGMAVQVTRVRTEKVTRSEPVAFKTTERKDPDLEAGTRRKVTAGVAGERAATYAVTYVDGKRSAKKLLSATVTKKPVAAVVSVGTKPAPAGDTAALPPSSADGLNWAALAQCESSGNPRAVNPAGYYGLYQFSLTTWRSVGGSGNPIDASPAEQLKRAKILYNKAGAGQWGCGRHLFS